MSEWECSMIWCPSQCEKEMPNGDTLYLRWRWRDPWQMEIINAGGGWTEVFCGEFTADEVEAAKAALEAYYENLLKEANDVREDNDSC